MRRSAAPSLASQHPLPNPKRAKFSAPFKASTAAYPGDITSKPHPENVSTNSQLGKENLPSNRIASQLTSSLKTQGKQASDSDVATSRYFNVVWCKASKKKHKKWDGDGILIVSGRTVVLKDSEGKDIGRSSGFKSAELESLCENSTLSIGGKELEIVDIISEEFYQSGRCFTQATQEATISAVKTIHSGKMLFVAPSSTLKAKPGCTNSLQKQMPNIGPRHDPAAPGAVVMPRPSASQQWLSNKKGSPIIDVVIDPFICSNLRPHQKEGVLFLYKCIMGMGEGNGNGAILADEMGLGKTLQCISLIWTLLKQGPYAGKPVIKRAIIVTPGSLVKNWCAEFKKWLGNERIKTFPVSSEKSIEDFGKSTVYPVMVVSYEMLLRYLSDVKDIQFDLIVCDEAHRLKNFGIKTTAAITGLGISRMVLLTGTPIQNDLREFYALGQLCNPGIFGTMSSFRQVFENPINKNQQPNRSDKDAELGEKRATELKRLADLFVLRRTAEVNKHYLPPKVELVVFCDISPLQRRLYEAVIKSRAVRSCISSCYSGSRHLVCISALKKLCNHPLLLHDTVRSFNERNSLVEDDDVKSELFKDSLYEGLLSSFPNAYADLQQKEDSGKLKVLDRLLEAFKHEKDKAVIVSNSTKMLDVFELLLKTKNRKFLRLDGQTSTNDRMKLVDRFNSSFSDIDVFLLSSKAGGTGLNLIGASRLILYDIDWNPANDIQAMARIWRDGQSKKVYIYRLLTTGTIEEKMFQRQISKQSLSGSIVDIKSKNVNFSLEDLKDLFTLQETRTCSTHELLNCNCQYIANPPSTTLVQSEVTRASQLGMQRNKAENKPLSMAELMSWTHMQPPCIDKLKDQVLKRCLEDVRFIFQNESDPRR